MRNSLFVVSLNETDFAKAKEEVLEVPMQANELKRLVDIEREGGVVTLLLRGDDLLGYTGPPMVRLTVSAWPGFSDGKKRLGEFLYGGEVFYLGWV